MRAKNSGISLTEKDASIVKGMISRGDRQHDIAAWFGVNGGRIGEISTGRSFGNVSVATSGLPPAGPYTSQRNVSSAKAKITKIAKQLRKIEKEAKIADLKSFAELISKLEKASSEL